MDVHLGFDPLFIKKVAQKIFDMVHIERIRCICECSGGSVKLFVLYNDGITLDFLFIFVYDEVFKTAKIRICAL